MRGTGWTLIVVGLVLIVWAYATQTSIHTDMDYIPGVGIQEAKDVLNLGLLQKQMMLLHCGIGAFVAGTIAACLGDVKVAMRGAGTAKYDGLFKGMLEPAAEAENTKEMR